MCYIKINFLNIKQIQIKLITKIHGIPYLNCGCNVLCLNVYIPIKEPILPKNNGIRSNVFSGVLHKLCFALYLSNPIDKKPIIFIIRKYIRKYFKYSTLKFIITPHFNYYIK